MTTLPIFVLFEDYNRISGQTWYDPITEKTTFYNAIYRIQSDTSFPELTADFIYSTIDNRGNIGNINGDFVGINDGSAIANTLKSSYPPLVSIGNITGNFVGTQGVYNFVVSELRNHSQFATIGDITSQLVAGNMKNYGGGFILNENGAVGDINVETAINNAAEFGVGDKQH